MHQPDYRDASGVMQMPWVFLHAIKDYYDMPWMMARHENVKATFNITSPIIEQLKLYYTTPHESDRFLSIWLKDPSYLQEDDRNWLIKLCKSTQFDTMVKPFERYVELYNQEHFNNSELVDLEVVFMLAWCGVFLRENNALVKELMEKKRNYNDDDKSALLDELSRFVSGIFTYYSQLHNEGIITISTTPLNHPILPLLMDMQNAVRANPNTKIPKDYRSLADDALLQVQKAQELFLDTFGYEADGFWPAEGAVDESSVKLLSSCGVKWIATDEEILFKSLNSHDRNALYSPYDYNGMRIGFRDHFLSDLIGFTYRHQDAFSAANHFMSELKKIQNRDKNASVFVILDGENAWEFFQNNAFDFFDALYGSLAESSWCNTVSMDEVKLLPAKQLSYIAPGSWIHGSFNTWVGHSEKTRGWELIYLTKRDYYHHLDSLDESKKDKISEHFLAAECSDWFWWYGDDHFTEFGAEFDELFRSHLISVYDLMNINPPADLFLPIIKDRSVKNFWLKPQSDIHPTINGKHDSFFEWIGCGVVDESKLFSTMDKMRGPIKKILYGQDDEKIYFAFEGKIKKMCLLDTITIIMEPIGLRIRLPFETKTTIFENLEISIVCDDWLEVCIDKTKIEKDEISVRFELEEDENIVQTLPGFGELKIDLGNDYSQNWFI
mgnify:CR=1 FL=1